MTGCTDAPQRWDVVQRVGLAVPGPRGLITRGPGLPLVTGLPDERGRRSGDQFNLYICDRFIVPALTQDQQRDVGNEHLLLDRMTRAFIHEHLSYRFALYLNGEEAFKAEREVRAGILPAGRPYLNSL